MRGGSRVGLRGGVEVEVGVRVGVGVRVRVLGLVTPRLEDLAREEHVHALVDVLVVAAGHGEHALHPEDVDALLLRGLGLGLGSG